jgi:hypothetical protein
MEEQVDIGVATPAESQTETDISPVLSQPEE